MMDSPGDSKISFLSEGMFSLKWGGTTNSTCFQVNAKDNPSRLNWSGDLYYMLDLLSLAANIPWQDRVEDK